MLYPPTRNGNRARRTAVGLLAGFLLFQVSFTAQKISMLFEFTTEDTWTTMWRAVSGRWVLTEDPTAPSPPRVITQLADYLDFPKIYLDQGEMYDYEAEVALKIRPFQDEQRPVPGFSVFQIRPEELPEVAHPRDYAGGLMLRYRGPFAFVAAVADARTRKLYLLRMTVQGLKVLKKADIPVELNTWYRLRAVCYLDQIVLYWNGRPVIRARERRLTGGRIGLLTIGTSRVYFDDFRVQTERIRMVTPDTSAP